MQGVLDDEVEIIFAKCVQDLAAEDGRVKVDQKTKPSFCKKYLSTRNHVVALESHLRSCTATRGLADSRAPSLPGRLLEGERRFFIDVADLPADVAAASVGLKRRSCIEAKDGFTGS